MRKLALIVAASVLASSGVHLYSQSDDFGSSLLKRLNGQFTLTKVTADGSDVVREGSILTLHKDGLQMCSIVAKIPLTNSYKDGKLSAGKFGWAMSLGLIQPDVPSSTIPIRSFVADEKFYIIGMGVEKTAVVLKVISDVYQDTRYYGQIAFPFNKKSVPPVEDLMKTIADVVTAEPAGGDAGAASGAATAPAAVTQPAEPPPPPIQAIAPPPPPPDAAPTPPPTVSLGQTMDQVIAILGQPKSVAKVGAKVILRYPDLKVTLLNGKVSDVE